MMSWPQEHTSDCRRGSSCRPAAGNALAAEACVRVERVTSCEAEDVVACRGLHPSAVEIEAVAPLLGTQWPLRHASESWVAMSDADYVVAAGACTDDPSAVEIEAVVPLLGTHWPLRHASESSCMPSQRREAVTLVEKRLSRQQHPPSSMPLAWLPASSGAEHV
jgi:hypothetical protein